MDVSKSKKQIPRKHDLQSYIYWDGFHNLEGEEQACFMVELTSNNICTVLNGIRFELGIILLIISYFLNKKDDFNRHKKAK